MRKLFSYLIFALCLSSMGSANAVVINFLCGNNTGIAANCATGEAQFSVTATDNTTIGGTSFLFENIGPNASSITDIYFDDASSAIFNWGATSITNGSGVSFSTPAAPPSPPGNKFVVSYSADSDPPAAPNGINNFTGTGTQETLLIDVAYAAGKSFSSLTTALLNETFGIALHAQAFSDGNSEWFGSPGTSVVPVPAAVWLFGTALLGFIGFSRRTQV